MATVEVRNGYKYYGSKSKPNIILNNLNMNVQPGSIYGLLGASGCGKTTLLSCIVGHLQLNGGEVRVLGQKPGVPGSGVSGSSIGYMPQDMALVPQMSVKESIYYFGCIYGMTSERIHDKYSLLKKLLELPPSSKWIRDCSGGQQRRVSFACALIHDPEVLILDEPTVGLDPLLRERIWDFLVSTARQSNTAVIITTHYIEEAKQANCIGLMRNGILLAEDTPENIMLRYEVNSLEDAFLLLSQRQGNNDSIETAVTRLPSQEKHQLQAISSASPVIDSSQTIIEQKGDRCNGYKKKNDSNSPSCWSTIKGPITALLRKNAIKMIRNPMMVAFLFLLPAISLSCFYLSVGTTVKGIKLGIVNTESNCGDLDMVTAINLNDTCYLNNTSCHFIRIIASTDLIKPVIYQDLQEAHRDAKKSYITGYIHIPGNFSRAMEVRLEEGTVTDDDIVEQTILSTHLDMTGGQIVYYTQLKLIEHFRTFMQDILTDCNFPKKYESIPVVFNEPIYGSEDADFQQFMVPGIVLTSIFFINTLVSVNIFIEERSEGVWDRTLIAGVSTTQLLWSHLFTQFIISAIQNVEVVLFCTFVFNGFNQGNMVPLVVLMFLISTGGMFYGLLLSVFCKTYADANYAGTGSYYTMMLLCGFLWPLEGMPKFLQYFASFTPFTLPSISARNIIEKKWEITHSGVYVGYLVISAWIIIFYVLCLVGLKRKM